VLPNLCYVQRIASQELQISDDELEDRLQQLYNLLPGKFTSSSVPVERMFYSNRNSRALADTEVVRGRPHARFWRSPNTMRKLPPIR
jgi:hypothetical protein